MIVFPQATKVVLRLYRIKAMDVNHYNALVTFAAPKIIILPHSQFF